MAAPTAPHAVTTHRRARKCASCGLLLLVFALLVQRPATAGETCPEALPEDPIVRREEARHWFDLAQAAQADGRGSSAIKHYVCSFKLVRHPFTAFNLGRLAEKTGDLELALSSYRAYLELAPTADDRAQVERDVSRLEGRLEQLNRDSNIRALQAEPGFEPGPPDSTLVAAPTPPAPAPSDRGDRRRLAGWLTLGGAALALGSGALLNVMARDDMDTCHELWDADREAAARACDRAPAKAYISYAAFGVGAAAALTAALLLTWPDAEPASPVVMRRAPPPYARLRGLGFAPAAGGGLLTVVADWR